MITRIHPKFLQQNGVAQNPNQKTQIHPKFLQQSGPAQRSLYGFKNPVLNTLDRTSLNIGRWAENKPFQSELADKIENPIGRFTMSIPESIWNIPGKIVHSSLSPLSQRPSFKNIIHNAGDQLGLGLDVLGLLWGGGTLNTLAKTGLAAGARNLGELSAKELFKQGTRKMVLPSMTFGAGYGISDAMQNDNSILTGGLKGAGYGLATAPLGGILPVASRSIGRYVAKKGAKFGGSLSDVPLEQALEEIAKRKAGINPKYQYIHPATGEVKVKFTGSDMLDSELAQELNSKLKGGLSQRAVNYFATSAGKQISDMGPLGKKIYGMLKDQQFSTAQMRGKWLIQLEKYVKPLSKESREKVRKAMEYSQKMGSNTFLHKGMEGNLAEPIVLTTDEMVAYKALHNIREEVAEWAKKNLKAYKAGQEVPWVGQVVENYFPHYFDKKTLSSAEYKENIINSLLKSGEAKGPHEAELMFQHMSELDPIRRSHSLEHVRRNVPGYITDPYDAYARYIREMSRRIPEIELFGQNREKLNPLLDDLASQGYDTKLITEVYEQMYGTKAVNLLSKAVDIATKIQVITKLSLGFFINMAQNANTIGSYGVKAYGKVLKDWFSNPGNREYMKETALLADAYEQIIMSAEAGIDKGSLTDKALWLFKKSEAFNRFMAANAGANRARSLIGDVINKKNEYKVFRSWIETRKGGAAIRELERLGINVEDIVTSGDVAASSDMLARAAYNAIENTQFRIDPLNLPLSWRTDIGRLLSQFKSFSFMQTKYIRDEIVKEAMQYNFAPLIRFAMSTSMLYFLATYARGIATGKNIPGPMEGSEEKQRAKMDPEKLKNVKHKELVADIFKITGTLPADLVNQVSFMKGMDENPYKTSTQKTVSDLGNILGPSVGDLTGLINTSITSHDIEQENRRELPVNQISPYEYPYGKYFTQKIPFVGPAMANTLFPTFPERERVRFRRVLKEALKSGDPGKIRDAMGVPTIRKFEIMKELRKEITDENAPQAVKDAKAALKERKYEIKNSPIIR